MKIKYKIAMAAVVFTVALCGCRKENSTAVIEDLTVNYRINPIGTETMPVFGWKMKDTTPGQKQTAYRITVADSEKGLEKGKFVWDSGERQSEASAAILYEGPELRPQTRYYWKVYVKDKDGKNAVSVEKAYFETGLSEEGWEGAKWICCNQNAYPYNNSGAKAEYTITYDFKMGDSYAGIMWGGGNRYGQYNLWAFDTCGEEVEFVSARMDNETVLAENRELLTDLGIVKESFVNSIHTMKIEIKGAYAQAYLDGNAIAQDELVDDRSIEMLGFWVTRGAYYAYFDNLRVTDGENRMLYEENFENEKSHIFSPFYIKITDGWLEASSGVVTTAQGETPAPMFRKKFRPAKNGQIKEGRLYITALGTYEAYLNGREISDEYFAPGASYYGKEVYYRTYDVTEDLVGGGDNTVGVVLGHGRYDRAKSDWGDRLALCAKLVIRYEDGTEEELVTDETWKTYGNGPIRRDDLFWGEYYDANYEEEGWLVESYDDGAWDSAEVLPVEDSEIPVRKAYESEPVMCVEERSPIAVTEPREGCFVYDFGQNFNGICRITVSGISGQVITLRYAEMLNEDEMICRDDEVGTVWTQNLYTSKNTDYYVMKGNGEETYEPQFVCRGFRYVQISGMDEALTEDNIKALVLTTQNRRTGDFKCSDTEMNTLYDAIYWTQVSNYGDIPTDCPQRDERLAWSGDVQVFAPSAAYNANIYTYMDRYLDALRAGQNEDGSIQDIGVYEDAFGGNNGWGDAIITIPWEMYLQYGNRQIIEENLDAMCRYMDYLVVTSEDFIRYDEGFGDHNAISAPSMDLINTAQCAHMADLLMRMCRAVGDEKACEKYSQIFADYKKAWQEQYINEDGSIGNWLPAEYTLGLAYGLYPKELEISGAQKLNMVVESQDYHMNTGYITTQWLLPVLCKYGYTDTAYRLVQQDSYPSWNYMFSHGGTTITEGWGTYYETENAGYGINGSLNHCALGSVAEWFYTDVLGIRADEEQPGFQHFILQPHINASLSYVEGSYESVYGRIESSWRIENGQFLYQCTVPANTSASVYLPDEEPMEVGAGTYEWKKYIPESLSTACIVP